MKTKQFSRHLPATHLPELHLFATNDLAPQHFQSINLARIFIERSREFTNLYWQPDQPIGAPVSNFRH